MRKDLLFHFYQGHHIITDSSLELVYIISSWKRARKRKKNKKEKKYSNNLFERDKFPILLALQESAENNWSFPTLLIFASLVESFPSWSNSFYNEVKVIKMETFCFSKKKTKEKRKGKKRKPYEKSSSYVQVKLVNNDRWQKMLKQIVY